MPWYQQKRAPTKLPRMSIGNVATGPTEVALPRGMLLAETWGQLGDAVAPLSNGSGRPLARTVKLILDPLVLRPVQNPQFAGGAVGIEHVDELRRRIAEAGPTLAATAAWFLLLKKARRRARITEGNPQDLYFQRCYELARTDGDPRLRPAAATAIAARAVEEIHEPGPRLTVAALRNFVTDPGHAGELTGLLRQAWSEPREATEEPSPAARVDDFLGTCATAPDPALFTSLVAGLVGTQEATALELPGVALGYGLTDRVRVAPPTLGESASKSRLPKPLDRSILERLFAGFTAAFQRESMDDIPSLVRQEIGRSARPWQLAHEFSRVAMVLGREAGAGLRDDPQRPAAGPATDAQVRLRSRWRREAYVHRVLRMPSPEAAGVPDELRADIRDVHQAYLRRLWVRLHGRELRREELAAAELWDVLDGVLRSVILDQRDRLRSALQRHRADGERR